MPHWCRKFDSTGLITKTVLDNALLLQVIAGVDEINDQQQAGCPFPGDVPDCKALATQRIAGMKIGILTEGPDQPLSNARVCDLIIKAEKALESLGCTCKVEEVSVLTHKLAPEIWAVFGRLSADASQMGNNCGRRVYCMNDPTEKLLSISQKKFDRMYAGYNNTIINGKWGWDILPPTLMGKATTLIRNLRDHYHAASDNDDVVLTPTSPYLATKLPSNSKESI